MPATELLSIANRGNYQHYSRYYFFGIAQSIRLSFPWRSCLGYRHAGCLQLSHRRPPEMCGLRTRPRTDIDPPRFFGLNCHRRGHIVSPPPGRYLVIITVRSRRLYKMRPIVTDVPWSVSVCRSRSCAVLKRLHRSRRCLGVTRVHLWPLLGPRLAGLQHVMYFR